MSVSPASRRKPGQTTSSAANSAEFAVRDIPRGRNHLAAHDKRMAAKSNNGRHRVTIAISHPRSSSEGLAQLSRNPNQLTRSENLRIGEAVAELDAEFEYLRQRLRKQVEEADVDGAEYTAVLMATTMSQIAIMQGAQRGDAKVISSMRQMGVFLWLQPEPRHLVRGNRAAAFCPRPMCIKRNSGYGLGRKPIRRSAKPSRHFFQQQRRGSGSSSFRGVCRVRGRRGYGTRTRSRVPRNRRRCYFGAMPISSIAALAAARQRIVPPLPAPIMKPHMPGLSCAVRDEHVTLSLDPPALRAAPRRRWHEIAVQPFGDATFEGPRLGFGPAHSAVVLGNRSALLVEAPPVVG